MTDKYFEVFFFPESVTGVLFDVTTGMISKKLAVRIENDYPGSAFLFKLYPGTVDGLRAAAFSTGVDCGCAHVSVDRALGEIISSVSSVFLYIEEDELEDYFERPFSMGLFSLGDWMTNSYISGDLSRIVKGITGENNLPGALRKRKLPRKLSQLLFV